MTTPLTPPPPSVSPPPASPASIPPAGTERAAARHVTGTPGDEEQSTQSETRALALLALVGIAALVRMMLPVGVGLFLGALVAFALQPSYEKLRKHMRPGAAALVCALGTTFFLVAALTGLSYLIVTRGVALANQVPAELAPGGTLRGLADSSAGTLEKLNINPSELVTRLQGEAVALGARAAAVAAAVATVTFGGLLTILFMTLMCFFVLRHWHRIVGRAELLLPFNRRHTRELLDQFRSAGSHVLLGTVSTGLVQGILAAIGYWITGAPEPAFFGALTAVASLVPAVGTLLIWVPLGIFQIVTGHFASGLIELIWGALIVGIVSDYVIRPRLVGSERGVPAVLTFVGLFGGVEVYGLIGLVLGPVIVTLAIAILRTYQQEVAETVSTGTGTPALLGANVPPMRTKTTPPPPPSPAD